MSPATSLEDAFVSLRGAPGLVWLDDATGGRSILAWDPLEVVDRVDDWPRALRALAARGPVLGYVSYEAGHVVERVPVGRPVPEPSVWFARYEGYVTEQAGVRRIVGPDAFRARVEERLAQVPRAAPPAGPDPRAAATTVDRERWLADVSRIGDWLRAGDCYQVNLTRPVFVTDAGDAVDAYRRLRAAPASHGAFVRPTERIAVLSNSPELLLRVDGRALWSDPIKGTRPRHPDPDEDARLRAELEHSDKDRAELTMIVDLVRNDLSRVAQPGTVRAGVRTLRSHPTVHHAHWPVSAVLTEGRDAVDALCALFPPGSVTGAPKIRATERIRELEPHARGVYCGAIGHCLAPDDATFSVAIRVAVFDGADARYHVGGGIVLDSDPVAEWEETVTKERALRAALQGGW